MKLIVALRTWTDVFLGNPDISEIEATKSFLPIDFDCLAGFFTNLTPSNDSVRKDSLFRKGRKGRLFALCVLVAI